MTPASPGTLLPSRLTCSAAVTLGPLVTVNNSSDAVYAISDGGRRWIRKDLSANLLLAEALGTLLAIDLGVPTAEGGYCVDEHGMTYWLSGLLEPVLHWDPPAAERLTNPDGLGAMLALDAIIGNTDRHAGNILLQVVSETELRAVSIDVANSWINSPHDLEQAGLDTPSVHNHARGIPVAMVRDGALALAARAVTLDGGRLVASCREACFLAKEPDTSEARFVDALTKRLKAAPQLVENHLRSLMNL